MCIYRALNCAFLYRKRKKAKTENEVAQGGSKEEKRRTRSNDKGSADRRDRNRLAQKKRRANMSAQKRRRDNEKKKDWWHKQKTETSKQPRASTSHDDNGDHIISPAARRACTDFGKVYTLSITSAHLQTVRATAKSSSTLKSLSVTYETSSVRWRDEPADGCYAR